MSQEGSRFQMNSYCDKGYFQLFFFFFGCRPFAESSFVSVRARIATARHHSSRGPCRGGWGTCGEYCGGTLGALWGGCIIHARLTLHWDDISRVTLGGISDISGVSTENITGVSQESLHSHFRNDYDLAGLRNIGACHNSLNMFVLF